MLKLAFEMRKGIKLFNNFNLDFKKTFSMLN